MREEIKQLISKLDEPYALPYYKGVPICDMNCEELRILCTWLTQIHFKGEKIIKEETYDGWIHCCNCDRQQSVCIPKGTTIEMYKMGKICFNCGCQTDGRST